MNAKSTFAAAVIAALAGFAGTSLAAPPAPCAEAMAGSYAELAQEMKLSASAKAAFDKYVSARQQIAGEHRSWHEANMKDRPQTRAEATKRHAEHLKTRADMLEKIAGARAELDKSLTPEQREFMDRYEPRYGFGKARAMGPRGDGPGPRHHFRGHRGPGNGPGYGPGYGPGFGPGCAGGPGCAYGPGPGPRGGDCWGWNGPRHGYGHYGWGPGCRW